MNTGNNHDLAKKTNTYESFNTLPDALKQIHSQLLEPVEVSLVMERNEAMKRLGANLKDIAYFAILRNRGELTGKKKVVVDMPDGSEKTVRIEEPIDKMVNIAKTNVKYWRDMIAAIDMVLSENGNIAPMLADDQLEHGYEAGEQARLVTEERYQYTDLLGIDESELDEDELLDTQAVVDVKGPGSGPATV